MTGTARAKSGAAPDAWDNPGHALSARGEGPISTQPPGAAGATAQRPGRRRPSHCSTPASGLRCGRTRRSNSQRRRRSRAGSSRSAPAGHWGRRSMPIGGCRHTCWAPPGSGRPTWSDDGL